MKSKIDTWIALADDDLSFAKEILDNRKRPHYAAHFCHQAIEKLLKAIIQLRTNSTPIPTHNFKSLCKQANLDLPEERLRWLMDLAPHYLGARYPEDIVQLKSQYTQVFCEKLYGETEAFFAWLKSTYLKS